MTGVHLDPIGGTVDYTTLDIDHVLGNLYPHETSVANDFHARYTTPLELKPSNLVQAVNGLAKDDRINTDDLSIYLAAQGYYLKINYD